MIGTGRKLSKTNKDAANSWKNLDQYFLGYTWNTIHRLFRERKKSHRREIFNIIGCFEEINREENDAYGNEKTLFLQDNSPAYASMKVMTKWNELKYELFALSPYSLDLGPRDYYFVS